MDHHVLDQRDPLVCVTEHTLLLLLTASHIHRHLCKCRDIHECYDILTHLRYIAICVLLATTNTASRNTVVHFPSHTAPSKDSGTIPTYERPCVKILRSRAVVLLAQVGISVTVDEGSNAGRVRSRYTHIHIRPFLRLPFSLSLPLLLSASHPPPHPFVFLSLSLRSSLHR